MYVCMDVSECELIDTCKVQLCVASVGVVGLEVADADVSEGSSHLPKNLLATLKYSSTNSRQGFNHYKRYCTKRQQWFSNCSECLK